MKIICEDLRISSNTEEQVLFNVPHGAKVWEISKVRYDNPDQLHLYVIYTIDEKTGTGER